MFTVHLTIMVCSNYCSLNVPLGGKDYQTAVGYYGLSIHYGHTHVASDVLWGDTLALLRVPYSNVRMTSSVLFFAVRLFIIGIACCLFNASSVTAHLTCGHIPTWRFDITMSHIRHPGVRSGRLEWNNDFFFFFNPPPTSASLKGGEPLLCLP